MWRRPATSDADNARLLSFYQCVTCDCAFCADNSDLERKFWKNVTIKPPLYGADVPGSLWDESFKVRHEGKACGMHRTQPRVSQRGLLGSIAALGALAAKQRRMMQL